MTKLYTKLKNLVRLKSTSGHKERSVSDTKKSESRAEQTMLLCFISQQAAKCQLAGYTGTAQNYKRVGNSFRTYLRGKDITLDQLTEQVVSDYEMWLIRRGLVRNSTSCYLRALRALYHKAVRMRLTADAHPFKTVYTGVDRTRKRAVDESVILRLYQLELPSTLSLARDLFVFSYFARGMAFVDVIFLRKSQISNGVLHYTRRKTGKSLTLHIEPCMERLIGKYRQKTVGSPYVFPIITTEEPIEAYRQYLTALNYQNRNLKRLADCLHEPFPLTTYTARHSWATNAHRRSIPMPVISEGMGHNTERTTRIYLADMDNRIIDRANSRLLDKFNKVVSQG